MQGGAARKLLSATNKQVIFKGGNDDMECVTTNFLSQFTLQVGQSSFMSSNVP